MLGWRGLGIVRHAILIHDIQPPHGRPSVFFIGLGDNGERLMDAAWFLSLDSRCDVVNVVFLRIMAVCGRMSVITSSSLLIIWSLTPPSTPP